MSNRFSRAMATADAVRRTRPTVTALPAAHTNPWPRNGVHKDGQYRWLVPSRSHPGDLHTVEWHHNETDRIYFTCTCPAGGGGTKMGDPGRGHQSCCRHVVLVGEAEKDDGLPERPRGHIGDTSRFTD